MSDISMPPEPPKPPQKHFLDLPAVKGLLALLGLAAPVPVLLALVNLWLAWLAPAEMKSSDAVSVFNQIFMQAGAAPLWLAPLSLLPSLALFMVIFRSAATRMAAAACLVLSAAAGIFAFLKTSL